MENNTKVKVLLVEDVLIAQLANSTLLKQLNCEVDIAGTGNQAIELVQKNLYNLILMDIGLPDINGIEVTRSIKNMEEPVKAIPIVGLTANITDTEMEEGKNAGIIIFFMKPLTTEMAKEILCHSILL